MPHPWSVQSQVGWDPEQPDLLLDIVVGNPAYGMGGRIR